MATKLKIEKEGMKLKKIFSSETREPMLIIDYAYTVQIWALSGLK
jgi:hypothetical protein